MKTKKRTSGSSNAAGLPGLIVRSSVFVLAVCLAIQITAFGGDKKAKDKIREPEPAALVAGTVFQSAGFLLRGAEVTLTPLSEGGVSPKARKSTSRTDELGEFVFRVPAVPGKYSVTAGAKGFTPETKEVTVSGEERVEVLFHLQPISR